MPHSASIVIIVILIAFSIYRRVRRAVTFQPLTKSRFTVRMVLLCVVGVMYLIGVVLLHPWHLLYVLAGIVIGGILAYFAIRTTVFEKRGEKWFYRPNQWIGIVLIVLFLGRFVYRIFEITNQVQSQIAAGSVSSQNQMYSADPLTAIVFFVLIAYYFGYYIFLMRKDKEHEKANLV